MKVKVRLTAQIHLRILTSQTNTCIATSQCSTWKVKGEVHLRRGHEGPEGEQRHNFTFCLTSALDGVGGQRHAPAALPPGKTHYPLYRRLGGPQGRSARVHKISPPTGFDPRNVQPVASRCTDWAITGHKWKETPLWNVTFPRKLIVRKWILININILRCFQLPKLILQKNKNNLRTYYLFYVTLNYYDNKKDAMLWPTTPHVG